MKRLVVLKDIGAFVCDEKGVEIFNWLHVANDVGFERGVLGIHSLSRKRPGL